MIAVNQVKHFFDIFPKEPRNFEREQGGRHEFSFFYGMNGKPGNSHFVCKSLLRDFIMLEAVSPDVVSKLEQWIPL